MRYTVSQDVSHFFHKVSEIRPIVWVCLYIGITPLFALIYWGLPDGQFRIPDGAGTDYGSWLYYSIVTITTLGFGDYTPARELAQAFTAVEVACGIVILGLFLNAVGAMKSEIDVESEIEKQKAVHMSMETEKLRKSMPLVLNALNTFLAYCYATTTPLEKRGKDDFKYNPDFKINDLKDMFSPSGLPMDHTDLPVVERLMYSAANTSLTLDSLQQRIDLTLWPVLLENCFSFVANYQIFADRDVMFRNPAHIVLSSSSSNEAKVEQQLSQKIAHWDSAKEDTSDPDMKSVEELYAFINDNARLAMVITTEITRMSMAENEIINPEKL